MLMPVTLKATLLWDEINLITSKSCFIIIHSVNINWEPTTARYYAQHWEKISGQSHGDMDNTKLSFTIKSNTCFKAL